MSENVLDAYMKSRPPAAAPVQRELKGDALSRAAAAGSVSTLRGMNARQMHQHLMSHYGTRSTSVPSQSQPVRSDLDALREAHRFLWDEEPKPGEKPAGLKHLERWGGELRPHERLSWEERLAKRYYDQLHKEYAIADMSRYREGGVGLRWRTEREVFDGKGQFVCGNKACSEEAGLRSFEVHFGYVEHGEQKEALVKLRVCPTCAAKLNYGKERKERKRIKAERKERKREKRRRKEKHEKKRRDKKRHVSRAASSSSSEESGNDGAGGGGDERGGDASSEQHERRGNEPGRNGTGSAAVRAARPLYEPPSRKRARAGEEIAEDSAPAPTEPPAAAGESERFEAYYERFVKELLL